MGCVGVCKGGVCWCTCVGVCVCVFVGVWGVCACVFQDCLKEVSRYRSEMHTPVMIMIIIISAHSELALMFFNIREHNWVHCAHRLRGGGYSSMIWVGTCR